MKTQRFIVYETSRGGASPGGGSRKVHQRKRKSTLASPPVVPPSTRGWVGQSPPAGGTHVSQRARLTAFALTSCSRDTDRPARNNACASAMNVGAPAAPAGGCPMPKMPPRVKRKNPTARGDKLTVPGGGWVMRGAPPGGVPGRRIVARKRSAEATRPSTGGAIAPPTPLSASPDGSLCRVHAGTYPI